MTYRALAGALGRLVPVYRERIVAALARALADGSPAVAPELLQLLDGKDISRAHRLAMASRQRQEVASIERRLARGFAAIKTLARRLVSARRGRTT